MKIRAFFDKFNGSSVSLWLSD